jgi:hypothetical protein
LASRANQAPEIPGAGLVPHLIDLDPRCMPRRTRTSTRISGNVLRKGAHPRTGIPVANESVPVRHASM